VVAAAASLAADGASAQPATVSGRATAVQGDQIAINNRLISLYGIDAPDGDQDRQCRAGNVFYGCYSNAKRALQILVDLGPATCVDTGERNWLDVPYMICTIRGEDIGLELVRQGWAVAFLPQSNQYVAAETTARAEKKGLWQTGITFMKPYEWRERNDRPIFAP
jgi:endonuclease YncB( thermonuclease family)